MARWMESKNTLPLYLSGLVLAIAAIWIFGKPPRHLDHPEILLIPPAKLHLFTLGYQEVVSDMLWLRAIQDLDYCETGKAKDPIWQTELCAIEKGWVYRMLDSITTLTPRYRSPYAVGATSLSVIVNDRKGAALIFERGIQNLPHDWSIQFRAAYHFLYELQDNRKAADLLVMAGRNGAPAWVYALASQLYTKAGQLEMGRIVLQDMIQQDPNGRFSKRLRERLAQLEEQAAQLREKPADSSQAQ